MTGQLAADAGILEEIRKRASRLGPSKRVKERIEFFCALFSDLKRGLKRAATQDAAAEHDDAAATAMDHVLTVVALLRFQHVESETIRAFRDQLAKAEELVKVIERAIDQLRALDVVASVGDPPQVGLYASGDFVCEHGRIRKKCERAQGIAALVESTEARLKATPRGPSRRQYQRHRRKFRQQLESLELGDCGPSSSYCLPGQRDYASLPEPQAKTPRVGRPVDEIQDELIRRLMGPPRMKGILTEAGLTVESSADAVLGILRLCFEGGVKSRDSLMKARRRLGPDKTPTEFD